LLGALIGGIIGFVYARRTPYGKNIIDWTLIHIPVFGSLVRKSILARFSRSLGNLLLSGIPIIEGMQINARGLGNEIYRKRVQLASEDLARGIPLGESLRDTPEFPNMLVQMISVGEQTAQLDSIALKVAEYYEDEVDTAVAGISKIIEPMILVVMGVIVGTIVSAIMMPIIQMTQFAAGG
jgi:type IV pilus assembly protein PilC